jgi:hypothetical protein
VVHRPVEDPGYLIEVVAIAGALAARRYRLGPRRLARLNQAVGAYGGQEPTWSPNHKSMRRKRLDPDQVRPALKMGGAKGDWLHDIVGTCLGT